MRPTSTIVTSLSNANLALLLRMALRAKLPWTVIVGSDATRAYKPTLQAYQSMAWILRLDPGQVMLTAAHNRDLTFAQRAGLGTAFIPRPTELGPGQTKDLTAEGDWDLICKSILDLGRRFADARNRPRLPPSVHAQASDLKQERISTSL